MEVGADLLGDTGFRSFWYTRIMCVFDVFMVDMDTYIYAGTQSHKVLDKHKRRKKRRYL